MTDKQIKDKVNVKECKYYCNGKCERYEEFVEADYANYSMKCICEEENCLGTYDICDYQQLSRKEQECEELKHKVELMMDCASCKVDEYKQTLTEIKEICNSVENIENINSLYDAKLSGMYLQAHKILQKISKCEVKNE